MASLPAARITHFTARRLRIKVPEKRRNTDFFAAVAERLLTWESVERVETNPLTASVLIYFSDPERLFLEAAAKNDLFDIDFDVAFGDSTPAVTEAAVRSFDTADKRCAAGLRTRSTCAAWCSSCCLPAVYSSYCDAGSMLPPRHSCGTRGI